MTNKYTRISNDSSLAMYEGYDNEGRLSLLVKLSNKQRFNSQTKFLETTVGLREDGIWALTISLLDEMLAPVFYKLINDLVDAVDKVKSESLAQKKLILRYNEWQRLFEEESKISLDYSTIVGLLGELVFIKDFMISKYGIENSIKSWTGPIGADKDFFIEDNWYEVKTKSLNKKNIHISTETQLKTNKKGYLAVINYEKASEKAEKSVNIVSVYKDLIRLISDNEDVKLLNSKLAKVGFAPKEEYQEYSFIIHEIDIYNVTESFPNIDTNEIHPAITNIKYDLYLPEIQSFRIKDEEI